MQVCTRQFKCTDMKGCMHAWTWAHTLSLSCLTALHAAFLWLIQKKKIPINSTPWSLTSSKTLKTSQPVVCTQWTDIKTSPRELASSPYFSLSLTYPCRKGGVVRWLLSAYAAPCLGWDCYCVFLPPPGSAREAHAGHAEEWVPLSCLSVPELSCRCDWCLDRW